MTPNMSLILVVGVLFAVGVYLLLERSLSRVLLGVILLGNGANLMILQAGGDAGGAPIVGRTGEQDMSDPLPQAMILTAIVITLAVTAFLLSVAHRSWQLDRHDEVQDDVEDRRIALRADDVDDDDDDDDDDDSLFGDREEREEEEELSQELADELSDDLGDDSDSSEDEGSERR